MIENFKKRTVYVLDNEDGDIPVGTIAVIGVAIIVGAALFLLKDQLKGLIDKSTEKVGKWNEQI